MGFRVFPLAGKRPAIKEFPARATAQALKWNEQFNIGVSTNGLLVVDVDDKDGKRGSESWAGLQARLKLPPTFRQKTPNGFHHVYRASQPIRNSVERLGPGLDVRGQGGYIVAAGSVVDGARYLADWHAIAAAPPELEQLAGASVAPDPQPAVALAEARARNLLRLTPGVREGQGGNSATYAIAAQVKDLGVDAATCVALMLEHWNPRCVPPWGEDELTRIVDHAYRYGKRPVGVQAPEMAFEPVTPSKDLSPIDRLNQEFAFVVAGNGHHIIWETTDAKGRDTVTHLPEATFHTMLAARRVLVGEKYKEITKMWIAHPHRRTYDGFCFLPGVEVAPRFYNLFRGFACKPLLPGEQVSDSAKAAVDAFFEHAFENVCARDAKLYKWLIGYFAHLVQKPWDKPLVALVFKGPKGVGKNALIGRVGRLLGPHYLVAANRRYLTSNFNGHMERLLLFVLDEAFWSGDKQVEGILKDLITGEEHLIEHKGQAPYTVDNKTRVVIIGNEDWVVPASSDERRYAVFNVGSDKQQNTKYFEDMRVGMEQGGDRLLLRRLLDTDISDVQVNVAPKTQGLIEQQILSMPLVDQWWMDCLSEGKLLGAAFETWPPHASRDTLRSAFTDYCRLRGVKSRVPDARVFGKALKRFIGPWNSARQAEYTLPTVHEARRAWERTLGMEIDWYE